MGAGRASSLCTVSRLMWGAVLSACCSRCSGCEAAKKRINVLPICWHRHRLVATLMAACMHCSAPGVC